MKNIKEWFDKAKKALSYIHKFFIIIWELDKTYLFFIISETLLFAIDPFPNMFLLKASADALNNLKEYHEYVVIVLFWIGIMFLQRLAWNYINTASPARRNRLLSKMQTNFFKKCLEIDYELLSDPDILNKKNLAGNAIYQGMASSTWDFLTMIANVIILLLSMGILLVNDITTVILTILIVIIDTSLSVKTSKKQYQLFEQESIINRKYDYYNNTFSDFNYLKEARCYNMMGKIVQRINDIIKDKLEILKKQQGLEFAASIQSLLCTIILNIAIYIILGYKVFSGKLTIGNFLLCFNALSTFKNQLRNITGWFDSFIRSSRYTENYFNFMEIESAFHQNTQPLKDFDPNHFEITFSHVFFKYPGQENYVLKDLNLSIRSGQKIAIVGENGSGKSTFIKLLMRLYDPTEGEIFLNGINIKNIDYDDYISIFTTVFQDFKLFAVPISKNIDSLEKETDMERITASAKLAEISTRIDSLKKGYETTLYRIFDDEGVEFSGGEQQKLSISRAIYKSGYMMIFDEPTATLDPRAEYNIYRKFNQITQNKSVIYISHRLSSTQFCNQIFVFNDGTVNEIGSHEELLRQNGKYAELYNLQANLYKTEGILL